MAIALSIAGTAAICIGTVVTGMAAHFSGQRERLRLYGGGLILFGVATLGAIFAVP